MTEKTEKIFRPKSFSHSPDRNDFPFEELPLDLKKQKKKLTELSDIEKSVEDRVEALETVLQLVTAVDVALDRLEVNRPGRRRTDQQCHSDHCCINLIDRKFKDQETFICATCKEEFHTICCGFFSAADCSLITSSTKCQACRFPGQFSLQHKRRHIVKVRKTLELMLNEEMILLENAQIEKETLQEMFQQSSGQTLREMERLMRSMGCDCRAWYQ
uniref:Zinc finger PHD-type domain-containing protein n=1 Tax=Caenorhabditis japonica TaxID=281687 RepID=A0A8R1E3H4_CAEJA